MTAHNAPSPDIPYAHGVSKAAPDLAALLPSWELALRAERKSPQTFKSYGDGVRLFLRWCESNDETPKLDRRLLARWVDSLLDSGAAAATARARQLAVRRFASWLADEGEVNVDPLIGVKAPKLDRTVIEPLTDVQLKALLKACAGTA
ncbi:MAG: site-specific integrase, partial [Actinomycetota bacterium]|nr:site-specific integrase [Actinomycetota bacterium]